jgi:hypothetical protein
MKPLNTLTIFFIILLIFLGAFTVIIKHNEKIAMNNFCQYKGHLEATDLKTPGLFGKYRIEYDNKFYYEATQTRACNKVDKWGDCKYNKIIPEIIFT